MKEREIGGNEELWKGFMEKPVGVEEIRRIVFNPEYKNFFRIRAMEISLAPDVRDLGYPINTGLHLYGRQSFCLSGQADMIEFFEKRANYEIICALADRLPKYIKKTEQAALVETDDGVKKSLLNMVDYYNDLVLTIFQKMPEDEANYLFNVFDIRDKTADLKDFIGGEYAPLFRLLEDKKINQHWKLKALDRMNKVLKNKFMAKEEVEDCESLVDTLSATNSPFLEMELRFLMENKPDGEVAFLASTYGIYRKIRESNIANDFLKRQIKFLKLTDNKQFSFFTSFSNEFIKKITEVFSDDQEMIDYISDVRKEERQKRQDLTSVGIKTRKDREKREDIIRRMKN